ncbi:MAG: ATP-dependent zinc metalloprotease FtsH [Clostridia bacterium]|nr:ATP-dependent zinc metalloprotease FtsH [Clostridia bacterium]
MTNSGKRLLITVLIIALVIVAIVLAVRLTAAKEISINEFKEQYISGNIAAISVEGSYSVSIKYNGDKKFGYVCYVGSRATFYDMYSEWEAEAKAKAIAEGKTYVAPTLSYNNPSSLSTLTSILTPLLMIIVMAVLFFWMIRKSGGGTMQAFDFGKTNAQQVKNMKVRFSDVAGADEEKQELQEIVEFLKNPKKFQDIGARIPHGVLLVGPPGTGKTLFAKAVAGEANVPFFSISGSDFVEMFVGVGASRVRDMFDQAKKCMPCIVFIDEIDAVGRQRGAGLGGGNDEREQTLNQLLVQMDGFESNTNIIVMAATNRSDILDPALMRPGRFDRQIYVNIPDVKGREEIFKVHARNKPLAPDVNFKSLARLTSGFTGADIENLLNEAAILAARENHKLINMHDVSEAIDKVIAGPAKKSRVVTETDKRITAYHESGHAIVARLLKHCDAVHEVSIIPRGMAAGYTITLPETDDSHVTRNKLLDTIAMMLGGRAAEELVIQDISTGASNDIQRASGLARKMVTEWGMSEKIGNMYLGASEEVFLGRDYQTQLNYSDDVAAQIDVEVKKILDAQYKVAIETIKANRDVLDKMVRVLFEKETIYEDEVDMLFEGKSVEDILQATANKEKPVVTDILKKREEAPKPEEKVEEVPAVEATTTEVVEEPKAEETKGEDKE